MLPQQPSFINVLPLFNALKQAKIPVALRSNIPMVAQQQTNDIEDNRLSFHERNLEYVYRRS